MGHRTVCWESVVGSWLQRGASSPETYEVEHQVAARPHGHGLLDDKGPHHGVGGQREAGRSEELLLQLPHPRRPDVLALPPPANGAMVPTHV